MTDTLLEKPSVLKEPTCGVCEQWVGEEQEETLGLEAYLRL